MPPAKNKNVIQKKKSYLDGIKAISNWLFSKRDEESIRHILEKYDYNNTILKRLASYVYNYPHIIWYMNKYMNDLYQFNKFDTVSLMYSFCYLIDINQRNNGKKLFYLKSNDLVDKNKSKIKDLFHEYFDKLYDKHYNELELNFYYDLINIGKISAEEIIEIDKHLNSGKQSINLEIESLAPAATPLSIENYSVLDMTRTLPKSIQDFCDDIKVQALKRPECQKCELFGKPVVVLDTNCNNFEEVDLAFIGLNPGTEETKANRPFVGKSGKLLRDFMSKLPQNVKWLITNIILCHTRNEKDIKNPEDCMLNCTVLIGQIFKKFKAKNFIPMGAKAATYFGIKESITAASGKKYENSVCSIIPLIHPSSAANYGQLDKFTESFKTIYNLYKTEPIKQTVQYDLSAFKNIDQVKQSTSSTINLADNKIITELTPDLTFFDVREVNDKIIKIFIDQNGQKKYLIEDYITRFYVKSDSWKDCNQITNSVDCYVNVSGKDKQFVTNKIRQKFNQIKSV